MNTVNREFACDDAKVLDVSDSYRMNDCGIDLKARETVRPVCLIEAVKERKPSCWKLNCIYCVYVYTCIKISIK